MKIVDGCKGCDRYWFETQPEDCPTNQRNKEGQCYRCKRCLACCENPNIKYSCAWKNAQKTSLQKQRSYDAYVRWLNHPNILKRYRRIF